MCRSVLKSCRGVSDYDVWESGLASILSTHPDLERESSSDSEEESQPGNRSSSEPPPSPPTSGETSLILVEQPAPCLFIHVVVCS